ncbi:MAG: toll/interleukin-1 receptor domain-containing protein [Bacteroidales bacterium]|nr:toll/interleukin-1 receptor domain-containing protein [Bacteroidales bacterium]
MNKPLNIYVLWHHEFTDGEKYANLIYSTFTRKIDEPLSRGIGIPVYFRSVYCENHKPLAIELNKAQYNVIIALIDDNMVACDNWATYLNDLNSKINEQGNNHILLPVAISCWSFNINSEIPNKNFIRIYDKHSGEKELKMLISICHEICRLLYGISRISEEDIKEGFNLSDAPVKLFLSHAKNDGFEIATKLYSRIDKTTALDSFFDTNDIAPGHRFYEEIRAQISQAVLLVLQTDSYSTREWCRKEVLLAKEFQRPIIIISNLRKGESRSFPYMQNTPTIRFNDNPSQDEGEMLDIIIFNTLLETLRFKYQELFITYLIDLYGLNISNESVLSNPPELSMFVKLNSMNNKLIIYPDPPLGNCELELLNRIYPDFNIITPIILPTIK